ncbi:MAG TPA: VUT family protein [Gaiellaceae bacterium]|nr:VUT family protein [Gaiellaceae bacterium]
MRFAVLTGLYVAVVCSAQIGALKIVRLPFTHLEAPGGVYSIGLALAIVQAAHYSAASRRQAALNAQTMIACGFVGSGILAAYIAIVGANDAAFPGQAFDAALGQTWRIVLASLAAFIVSETVDNLVGAPLRGRVPDGARVALSSGIGAPLDSVVFLTAAFGSTGLHFFAGQLVGKVASAIVIGLPLVYLVRRHVRPA